MLGWGMGTVCPCESCSRGVSTCGSGRGHVWGTCVRDWEQQRVHGQTVAFSGHRTEIPEGFGTLFPLQDQWWAQEKCLPWLSFPSSLLAPGGVTM